MNKTLEVTNTKDRSHPVPYLIVVVEGGHDTANDLKYTMERVMDVLPENDPAHMTLSINFKDADEESLFQPSKATLVWLFQISVNEAGKTTGRRVASVSCCADCTGDGTCRTDEDKAKKVHNQIVANQNNKSVSLFDIPSTGLDKKFNMQIESSLTSDSNIGVDVTWNHVPLA